MHPSGELRNSEDRRASRVSFIALSSLGLAVVVFAALSDNEAGTVDLRVFRQSTPGAIAALALLLIFYAGEIDLSLGGTYALVLVALGTSPAPNDQRVVAAAAIGIVVSMLVGAASWLLRVSVLVTFACFYIIRGVAFVVSDGVTRSSLTENSVILRALGAERFSIPAQMLLLIVAVLALTLLLLRSGFGRRLRACGIDADRARMASINVFDTRTMVRAIAGLLVSLAALTSFSRLGATSPAAGDTMFFTTLAAFVVGNGGIARRTPAPARVAVAYILLDTLLRQLELRGYRSDRLDMLTGVVALAVIAAARQYTRGHYATE